MQWLNKVDDALNYVLGPVQQGGGDDGNGSSGGVTSEGDADAIAAAAMAAAGARPPDASSASAFAGSAGSDAGHGGVVPAKGPLKPPTARDGHETGGRRQRNNELPNTANKRPPPPPPPYPPPVRNTTTATTTTPPPPATTPPIIERKRSWTASSSITDDQQGHYTCPSTPLVAMAGEFLVLDESPYPSKSMNENCDDGDQCPPPESIFTREPTEMSIREEAAETTIREEDAAAIRLQQEAQAEIMMASVLQSQTQLPTLMQSSQTNQSNNHDEQQQAATANNKARNAHSQQTMQDFADFAKASPAPTKVTIGDRERESLKLHGSGNLMMDILHEDGDDATHGKKPPPPPPPPPIWNTADDNDDQQQSTGRIQMQTNRREPPSPSTFVIQMPSQTQQRELQPSPMKLPLPLPPMGAPSSHYSWAAPSTPNPIRPQPKRATPRPTPGVIRRRLREPSLSPPDSPTEEEQQQLPSSFHLDITEDNPAAAAKKPISNIPSPPFIPPDAYLDSKHDEVRNISLLTDDGMPPSASYLDNKVEEERVDSADGILSTAVDSKVRSASIPPPPFAPPVAASTETPNNDPAIAPASRDMDGNTAKASVARHDDDDSPTSNDVRTSSDAHSSDDWDDNTPSAKGVKHKVQIIKSIPHPPFHDQITPITQNRKSDEKQPLATPSLPLNKVIDDEFDVDHVERVKENEKDREETPTVPPKNQVDKALNWMLGPVLAPTADEGRKKKVEFDAEVDADAGDHDADKGGQEKVVEGEPMTDAIAGWFKRMGSTDGQGVGKQKAAKEDTVKNKNTNDDDRSFSDNDSVHSQITNDSELTDSNAMEDFALPSPSFSQLQDEDDDHISWDPSLNRYGFFHVRLLRAQRLPCAAGSSINSTLSLQPWKGLIRIPAHLTIDGPSKEAGVCLRWDKPLKRGDTSKGSKDAESPPEDPCSHSMVHAYNNEDTPVPTIALELSISSLGASLGGVFDRFLCSVSVPCHDLLRNPRSWTHKWYPASRVQGGSVAGDNEEGSDDTQAPWILLEVCFEPKVTRATVSTLSNQVIAEDQEEEDADETELNNSGDSDTLGSIPHIIRPNDRKLLDDDSISKSSTLTPALIPRKTTITKAHLLRVRSYWTPAWCAVCGKNITTVGWSMQSKNFECEACHIFCCRDCQLQVDARIPCGSELATIAVKKAQQYQVPSFGQIMTTLAPQLSSSNIMEKMTPGGVGTEANDSTLQQSDGQSNLNILHEGRSIEGIGIMNIRVLRACLFGKTFPSEAEPDKIFKSDSNLHNGDHYVRVSWMGSKESKRTKTVLQTSKPFFDSEEMVFDVPHYGMEYKLEVVDANTDKPIGSCLLSAQGLLQWQRDGMLAKKDRMLLSLFKWKYSEPCRVQLELRTGVKDGFGLNFYNSSKVSSDPNKRKEAARPGEISGWLELDVHLEEDRQLFYSATPRQCPPRAEEEFDIALIQLHIARIGAILEGIQKLVSTYMYVVSWENPKITGASIIIFIVLTLRFNVEYLGALPIGCLVLYMVYLAYLRINGNFKDRWTLQEKKALVKSETKIEKNQSIFRPLGLLQVGDLQGKHLRSRELGLPGSFYASIMYDPLRYADEKMKSTLIKIDSSSGCAHEVGATVSPGITSNPVWTHVQASPELMRLKHLLPDDRIWSQEKEMNASLAYPILQPITDGSFNDEDGDDIQHMGVSLMPWEQSSGAVVIQVRFSDMLGGLQMFDNVLGEVVIPLAKLAGSGRAVEGWFRLLTVGTTDTVPGESSDDTPAKSFDEDTSDSEEDAIPPNPDFPELYVRVKFSSNTLNGGTSISDDMESFKVICEEMSRTASIAQDQNSIGVIGSSLNTINTVRTLGGKLQNQISFVVDMLERFRNAFNFSNPRITVFILLGLTVLWIVLALIPTRIVVLFGGLGQFGATFYAQFVAQPAKKKSVHKEKAEEGLDSANKGNPIENLFLSIPTDEDLRRTYFWEARRMGEKEREKFAIAKRQTRLEKLWKAKWHGALELKEKKSEQPTFPTSSKSWSWEPAFALLEGHRFIWWRSEKHFDTGEAPLGEIFFAGHSGLAGLSPLDLRELTKEEIPFVVSIFGRGSQSQQKITLLAPSAEVKDTLENAVLDASMGAKAD